MKNLGLIMILIFNSWIGFSQTNEQLYGCWRTLNNVDCFDEYYKFTNNDSCFMENVDTWTLRKINTVTGEQFNVVEYRHEKEIGQFFSINDSAFSRKYFTYYSEMFQLKELPFINCDTVLLSDKNENIKYHEFMNELLPKYRPNIEIDTFNYKIQSDTLYLRKSDWVQGKMIKFKKIL